MPLMGLVKLGRWETAPRNCATNTECPSSSARFASPSIDSATLFLIDAHATVLFRGSPFRRQHKECPISRRRGEYPIGSYGRRPTRLARMCKSLRVTAIPLCGVLFDWRGTLVCDPEEELWLQAAAARLGREIEPSQIAALLSELEIAAGQPDLARRLAIADCSATDHRAVNLDLFLAAGMDAELGLQLYELDFEPDFHPFYPDVADVFASLNNRGIAIAIVSNIHFDLRPEFRAADLDRFVDAYVLSFEHNVQKPDAAMFDLALSVLGFQASEVLMVGDDPRRDGAAALYGIRTLLVPPLRDCVSRGLEAVLALTR